LFTVSTAAPQKIAYSEVTFPDVNPTKDWQSTVGYFQTNQEIRQVSVKLDDSPRFFKLLKRLLIAE
jgi:hypothetical protein